MPIVSRRAVAIFTMAAALGAAACSAPDESVDTDRSAGTNLPATIPAPTQAPSTTSEPETTEPETSEPETAEPATSLAEAAVISPPRQVRIPSIEVDAQIIDLGLTGDGSLETPSDFDLAGWWAGGTVADAIGPTVIVGHIDDFNGPAVFFRLQELEVGDPIIVIDDLGREQRFEVVDKDLYDKTSFPTERVYGASDRPTLRLVTCGGDFDRSERSYESNWVVFAEQV